MSNEYPIIANGEVYSERVNKKGPFIPPKMTYKEFKAARKKLANDINSIKNQIKVEKEIFLDTKILCVRMKPNKEAKSYLPESLVLDHNQIGIVGGTTYEDKEYTAKLYFLKTTTKGIDSLENKLTEEVTESGFDYINKNWVKDIANIQKIDLLNVGERVFDLDEFIGHKSVEMIVHPIDKDSSDYQSLKSIIQFYTEDTYWKQYKNNSIVFISAFISRQGLDILKNINYIRSIAPLEDFEIYAPRDFPGIAYPHVLSDEYKPLIKVGVFDGGVRDNDFLLKSYIRNHELIAHDNMKWKAHGTAVASILLHGDLKDKTTIKTPDIFVESFQVMPNNDIHNQYKTIDLIESIVQQRKDIKIFNISFGPKYSISDNYIDRFTYSLDRLTMEAKDEFGNPLFIVAVGNDNSRIQPAGDLVNGIGVGAYFYEEGIIKRATYSCYGPGREGGKVKPDVLEYGGSSNEPIYAASLFDELHAFAGTSFAAPLLARKIASLQILSDDITPHTARTLVIHTADSINDEPKYIGHGVVKQDELDIITSGKDKVTILYKGVIPGKKYVKLPIYLPNINFSKANIKWTITALVDIESDDTDAYTKNCIEDTFYPNSFKYYYYDENNKCIKVNKNDVNEVSIASTKGYTRCSDFPCSSSPKNMHEKHLRNKELKWDTIITKHFDSTKKTLNQPFIILKATGRGGNDSEDVQYHAAITISLSGCTGNLYNAILKEYTRLNPIRVNTRQPIKIKV